MSKLTYKIKHNKNLLKELSIAKRIAEFAIRTRTLSSKDVKCFGLKSVISNQILRKYSRNKKCKNIKSVKLTIPGQGIKFLNNNIYISSLKLNLCFNKQVEKINQIELDNVYAYISCTVLDETPIKEIGYIGIDRNATGHIAVCAIDHKILKMGKRAQHIRNKYKNIRSGAQKLKKYNFIKKLKNKESRIIKDINHKISRKIINIAKEKNYAIKLEKLNKTNKNQGRVFNNIKSNWPFYQLETFIKYKAKLLGVKVFYVDPHYTSQTCSRCGLIKKENRNKKNFLCGCGHNDHADANAAFNIAKASMCVRSIKDRDLIESNSDIAQGAMVLMRLTPEPLSL